MSAGEHSSSEHQVPHAPAAEVTVAVSPTPSASTSPVGHPAPAVGPSWALGRLTKIELQNYRAVRGNLVLDLCGGKNIIIYGENGSGKSSIFHALRDFLESPETCHFEGDRIVLGKLPIGAHRHRYSPGTDLPKVILHFGESQMVWSETDKGPEQREARDLNKGKAFLDYPTLQSATHIPFGEDRRIDLFRLFIGRLLPYYTFPCRGRQEQFQLFWQELTRTVRLQWRKNQESIFLEDLETFNAALEAETKALGQRASKLLARFGDDFQTEFQFAKAEFKRKPKRIVPPRISATPSLRKLKIDDYYSVLNEARLSALATCLFFAAVEQSPATSLRILALDDILIGLDMANRLVVLELICEHFSQWQVLILTYSKAWFELLKERVQRLKWPSDWEFCVLHEKRHGEETSPRIVVHGSGDLLEMARYHLTRKDYKAAAVYARSALEALCNRVCATANLAVLHVDEPRKRKLEHFLAALKGRLETLVSDDRREKALVLISRLTEAQRFVLNRNAHFDAEQEETLSAEVAAALDTVKEFGEFLNEQTWEKSHFQNGRDLTDAEQMKAYLATARELSKKQAYKGCRSAMTRAHECFWRIYGEKLKVAIPLGAKPTASLIWKAAAASVPESACQRLKEARPYLFGTVGPADFDLTKLEAAINVLEDLAQGS